MVDYTLYTNADISVTITDITGKVVLKEHLKNRKSGFSTWELNIGSLANGVYSLQFQVNENSISKRIVKN
jgi:hypothetical protein